MAELTPMMQQYFEIKNKNKDYILFSNTVSAHNHTELNNCCRLSTLSHRFP